MCVEYHLPRKIDKYIRYVQNPILVPDKKNIKNAEDTKRKTIHGYFIILFKKEREPWNINSSKKCVCGKDYGKK